MEWMISMRSDKAVSAARLVLYAIKAHNLPLTIPALTYIIDTASGNFGFEEQVEQAGHGLFEFADQHCCLENRKQVSLPSNINNRVIVLT
jgi:hypothetical protein